MVRYILDGYPLTKNQIDLMTQRKIIPVKVLELHVEEEELLRRGTVDRHAPTRYGIFVVTTLKSQVYGF